jgi:hypothetical protein
VLAIKSEVSKPDFHQSEDRTSVFHGGSATQPDRAGKEPAKQMTSTENNGFVDSGSSPPAPTKPADGLQSFELPLSPVPPQATESVELPLCAECGVTPVSRKGAKFCRGACRQAAYRKSPAHARSLKRLADARTLRRRTWEQRKARDKALGTFRGYGGPEATGVPRLGMLDLKNFKKPLNEQ